MWQILESGGFFAPPRPPLIREQPRKGPPEQGEEGAEKVVRKSPQSVLEAAWHNKEFPDELELMDVTKIYKKDDPNKSKNYRRVIMA